MKNNRCADFRPPFFIVGCVRSGTTMLRNVLRTHPNLCCPEETHFFRWGDAFGTPRFNNQVLKQAIFQKHRSIDGVSEDKFSAILSSAISKGDLWQRYMKLFVETNGHAGATRWFDKSPQNIYGILLINEEFPDSKFVHIVRCPLNVVASLKSNETLPIKNEIAACNYWNEAIAIANAAKKVICERFYELCYEALTDNPAVELEKLCNFLEEDYSRINYPLDTIHSEENKYLHVLHDASVRNIERLCGKWGNHYGYF